MNNLVGWAINNAKSARTEGGLAAAIPFAIWQRQWEVCDLTGNRSLPERIVSLMSSLAERNPEYRTEYLYMDSARLFKQGKFQEALEKSYQALDLSEEASGQAARVHGQIGSCYYQLGNFTAALEHLLGAEGIYSLQGQETKSADILNKISLAFWKKGDYDKALETLERAEAIHRRHDDRRALSVVMHTIGNVLLGRDQTRQAEQYYLKSLEITRAIGNKPLETALLNNLAGVEFRRGSYRKAIELFQQGLALDLLLGNIAGRAKKLNNLGALLATIGKPALALEHILSALELDRQTGNIDGQMAKLGNISSLLLDMGRLKESYEYIEQGVEKARNIGSKAYLSQFLGLRVTLLHRLGDTQLALKDGIEAIEISSAIGNRSNWVRALINMGDVYLDNGNLEKAMECSAQALSIYDQGSLFEIEPEEVYFSRFRALQAAGRVDEGLPYLDKAYRNIIGKAREITDDEGRKYFLEQEPMHRQIIEEWKDFKNNGSTEDGA